MRKISDMKSSKLIWMLLCLLLAIALLICTLPLPQRVELTLQAKAYTREGLEYVEDVPIVIEGYRLHYLLRDTELKLSLDINGDDTLQTY